ncbi:MAG: nicotinamide-nucleotide adenylyltransferase [Thermoplasmata archaeon]|jgi:nicotinamide-nucleotide adenylyltransferase|nr:nicotinamide-nucleotide adenylyltransferase [Thermoplasmata archaeon]
MRGLLVGRFQPFHLGHLQVVRTIHQGRPEAALLLAIGSAEESYTWKNPFTAGERFEMIDRALGPLDGVGYRIVPVADIRRHAQWVAYLESFLPPFDRVYTNNPLTRLLFERAGYAVESPPLYSRTKFEGEHIRTLLARGRGWRELVSAPVAEYLTEIEAPHRLSLLRGSARSSPGASE